MDTSFRFDINGLRALAVFGVVSYHFDLGLCPGGFAGVDVFFVVSGFLMTRIILGRLEADRFSLLGFYAARAQRILPALIAAVLAVLVVSVAILNPLRLSGLSQAGIASLLFVSNFTYLKEAGYFASAAHENWLLHTWSLSLEWQFYLLFPLLLMALKRIGSRRTGMVGVLLVLAVPSFAWTLSSHFTGGGTQDAAFYLLPARAWEFIAGGLCVFARPLGGALRWRQGAHYAGCAMIAAAMVMLNAQSGWPSALTLVPVAGAVLVLLAGRQDEIWSRVAPTRAIGRWSYSIYLWHWPIAALLMANGFWSLPNRLSGIAVAVGISGLSYRFIETRAVTFVWSSQQRLLRYGTLCAALPLTLASLVSVTHGFEAVRYASNPKLRAELADYRAAIADWRFPQSCTQRTVDRSGFATCTFGDPSARDVLVIGDSLAEQLAPRYAALAPNAKVGITFVTRGGCSPLPGVDRRQAGAYCTRWSEAAYAFAEHQAFKRIVFIGSWLFYSARSQICLVDQPDCGAKLGAIAFAAALDGRYDDMAARWRRLKAQGKDIVAIDIMPFGDGNPEILYQHAVEGRPVEEISLPRATFDEIKAASTGRLTRAVGLSGATLVEPADFLCPTGVCPIVENGHTLFKDEMHFRSSIVGEARFDFLDRSLIKRQGSTVGGATSDGVSPPQLFAGERRSKR